MADRIPLNPKHRHLTFYPGVQRREQVQALMQVLKDKGTTLSGVMRPFLDELMSRYKPEIEAYLGKRDTP